MILKTNLGDVLTAAALTCAIANAEQARAPGEGTAGLQAVVVVPAETLQGQPVPVTLELCGVSDQPVLVDQWIGNWFVDVTDSSGRSMPHRRAVDVLRPMPVLRVIAPGQCWKTELQALRLVAHLPPSTPLWEYHALPLGTYGVRAEFEAHATKGGLGWSGKAVSGTAHIHVR